MRASTVEIADLQEIINLIDGKTRGVYSHKRCQSKFKSENFYFGRKSWPPCKLFSVRRLVETTQLSFKVVEDDNKIVGFAAFDLEPDFESKKIQNDLYTPQSVLELMLFMAEEDHPNVDAIVSCVISAVFKRKGFQKTMDKTLMKQIGTSEKMSLYSPRDRDEKRLETGLSIFKNPQHAIHRYQPRRFRTNDLHPIRKRGRQRRCRSRVSQ